MRAKVTKERNIEFVVAGENATEALESAEKSFDVI